STASASATTRASAVSSARSPYAPGGYIRPSDRPTAPPASAVRSSPHIRSSSSGVGGRASKPTTQARIARCPASKAIPRFVPARSTRSRYSPTPDQAHATSGTSTMLSSPRTPGTTAGSTGATASPQLPATSVVTPWVILLVAAG